MCGLLVIKKGRIMLSENCSSTNSLQSCPNTRIPTNSQISTVFIENHQTFPEPEYHFFPFSHLLLKKSQEFLVIMIYFLINSVSTVNIIWFFYKAFRLAPLLLTLRMLWGISLTLTKHLLVLKQPFRVRLSLVSRIR